MVQTKKTRLLPVILLSFMCMNFLAVAKVHAQAITDESCRAARSENKFLGIFPPWYAYIEDYKRVPVSSSQLAVDTCGIVHADGTDTGDNLKKDAVAIGLAIIDILLRAGALVAVGVIMLGGYKYMSSQGEPKNLEAALATLVNAAIGLGIVLTATVLVAFIGNTLGG